MAKAKKEGKPKRNRGNLVKNLKRIARNEAILKRIKAENETHTHI
jgi:hypothetical protein